MGTRENRLTSTRFDVSLIARRGCGLRHGNQVGAHAVESFRPDSPDATEVRVVVEGAVGFAVVDNPLGQHFADPRHQGQLRPVGGVHVDLEPGQVRLDLVDFNQAATVGRLPGPVGTDGQQGEGEKEGGNGLVAAAEKEDRPAGWVALAVRRRHRMSSQPWSYPNLNRNHNLNPLRIRPERPESEDDYD